MNTRDSSTSTARQYRGPIPFLARSMKFLIATAVLALAACGSNGPLGPAENGPTIGKSVLVGECPGSVRVVAKNGSEVTQNNPSAGCLEFESDSDRTIW